ncbi:hypothetical protein RE428_48600 (plasmid) [Marinobacter nanhaiticus D15-8W]|uniref:Uncharacterized protein n=1 Tax=Marinobacter nanhaiticus D15-8W TaxID=626887 RepID=N6W3J5_9GAMM|nr:hypothetical protein [Marinobacter nanhaiticus]ENO17115.1 hypothetical protein J057_00579 [Marinobacter nanhaiticus D15-8W]BES73842.1 hypothetical protein RE428_48600 [Marinobacter nanhaiticus D15-8W]
MSFLDRLFGFGKEVLLLTAKTEQLSKNVEKLSNETQDMDRRIVRVETILDMARYRAAERQKTLPSGKKSEKD